MAQKNDSDYIPAFNKDDGFASLGFTNGNVKKSTTIVHDENDKYNDNDLLMTITRTK